MIKRQNKLVITFHTTTAAMAMERICKECGADGRIIPVPGSISLALEDILYDPQTSGGLLFALPEAEAQRCLAQLRQAIPAAAIIGYVTEKEDAYIILE